MSKSFTVNLRLATAADLHALVEVALRSPTAAHWSEEQYRRAIERRDNAPDRLVLVAEIVARRSGSAALTVNPLSVFPEKARKQERSTVVGLLVARRVEREWELENIAVVPEFRGQGVGQQLLAGLLARAKESNSAAVFLEVRESNAAARTLYEKAGFRMTGWRKLYYADPAEDGVLYSQDL